MRLSWHQSGIFLLALLCFFSNAKAQDEGTITKKARFSKASTLYLQLGPGFAFGGTSGDYRGGLHLEIGFTKRKNRILSFGPTLSYQRYGYKTDFSNSFQKANAKGNNTYFEEGGYEVVIFFPSGGDVQLISLGVNLTAFLVPPADGKSTALYAIVAPKIMRASRSEVDANSESWFVDNIPAGDPSTWSFSEATYVSSSSPGRSGWAKESALAGGFDLGIGSNISIGNGFELQLTGVIGTGFGVPHIHTKDYRETLASYNSPDFPFSKKVFTAFNLGAGISYTF